MNEVVAEWVEKAEGDYFSALREYRARKHRNSDACCFHAQQCIEKHFKGLLQNHVLEYTKTHDLVILMEQCAKQHPLWSAWRHDLELLTRYAVHFRYPGEQATREEAKKAVSIMKGI